MKTPAILSTSTLRLPSRSPRAKDTLSLDQALVRSEPLTRLARRLQDSAERFAAVRSVLPEGLAAHVAPGPVDERGWSLLAANAAVAAKLRQLKPRIEASLQDRGWPMVEVRVKILPSAG